MTDLETWQKEFERTQWSKEKLEETVIEQQKEIQKMLWTIKYIQKKLKLIMRG